MEAVIIPFIYSFSHRTGNFYFFSHRIGKSVSFSMFCAPITEYYRLDNLWETERCSSNHGGSEVEDEDAGRLGCLVRAASSGGERNGTSSHAGRQKGKNERLLEACFMWALIPFIRGESSWCNHLLKATLFNTITLVIKFQNMNFGENTFKTQQSEILKENK